MHLQINQQKPADKSWKDEAGSTIPYARTTAFERLAEKELAKIAKNALAIHNQLAAFKSDLKSTAITLYDQFIKDHNAGKPLGKGKGGATFYNFDRSIKVEVSVNDNITFDENTIQLAKEKLDEVLNDGLTGAKEFVKPLVMDAFKTSNGNLDTKRVLGLRRYADRVKDTRYAEAMQLIDKAIRRPTSKEFFRVWVKDENGEYNDIILQFSAIDVAA